MLALKKLQGEIAKEINIPLGSLTMISISAHIYENNWEGARRVIEQNLENKIPALKPDKNGYFLIKKDPTLFGLLAWGVFVNLLS